jgi:hypothetical protein
VTAVTAAQLREVIGRLGEAGQWRAGDPEILIVFDAGYDVSRLAFLLADLPVQLLGRLRSDRVFCFPPAGTARTGRPAKHGPEFCLSDPATHPEPVVTTSTPTTRYGTARACAWSRLHPRLTRRAAWAEHDGPLPVITGSIIRLHVDRLPGDRHPKPVWLWCSTPDLAPAEVDRLWQAFLRRFDLEHTFRFLKQTLGVDPPQDPHPRPGRPLDLADPHRPHPTATGPPPRRGPTPPLGETRHQTRPAHPGQGPPRVS